MRWDGVHNEERNYNNRRVLIDFIPQQKGFELKNVVTFERNAGGAPLNVAANVAKRGGKASVITQLGCDAFGDYIYEEIEKAEVGTDKIFRTSEANTALAFVSLSSDGNRSFSFYRNPCADILKVSDDELEFIFGTDDLDKVKRRVFDMGVSMLVVTLGADGAVLFTKGMEVKTGGVDVVVVDTTGAGDSFIGSFVYALTDAGIKKEALREISEKDALGILEFANRCAAHTTTKKGAIV